MASVEYYVCEQCGAVEFKSRVDLVRVFGMCLYFCSDKCRTYWLGSRKDKFYKP